MAAQEHSEHGSGGDGSQLWDFRLDRSGLVVKAGRHLQLHISLVLLLWLVAGVAGLGAFNWEWPPTP
ncbi:hypothetical protein OG920_27885 [Streptomyces europaeiscabiei]|uniref:hypothetical protein n=1 Tax=Streptomyces TaxID=1883 RepID=UPI000A36D41C|nr:MULTISPECIES: hypothetical protein [Streptomyces]MDX3586120.1 hypothetical protein [Streptomyces europaeiscabiei]MDX3616582.1 hypothetical protein [Streptomyces europaeiscabiei]MDX3633762.1 hypothetical protein [Streptomyces europaeiscabiei]MDX3650939.1 hypothetical protein [Streptomyces europaeiscabiei]WUD34956.1 hypothetical protein OG858_28430 [Streptomyces europaeiscabiei]